MTKESNAWPHAGLFIVADIAGDKDLTLAERFVLAYVDGWTRAGKPCFASSAHMGEVLGLAPTYVRTVRAGLVEKGKLTKRVTNETTVYERVSENLTGGVRNSDRGVRNSDGGCKKIEQGVSEILTLYNNYDIDIKSSIRESTPTPPAQPVQDEITKYSKQWFEAEAKRYLAKDTGNESWERDNQFVLAGRRPMTKYPALWFTPGELADALEVVISALPEGEDIRPVFKLAQSEALSQAVNRGSTRKVTAYKYVTGYCLQQHQETLRKTGQLKNLARVK